MTCASANRLGRTALSGGALLALFPALLLARAANPCFPASSEVVFGTEVQALAVADFDHDGRVDLAVLASSEASIRIARGVGTGAFQLAEAITIPAGSVDLKAADLNEDGWPDLVLATPPIQGLTLLLRNANGIARTIELGGLQFAPELIAVMDFNRDQHLDIAVAASTTDVLQVLWGDGTGAFSISQRFELGIRPSRVLAGDFNGDQLADLAIASADGQALKVLLSENSVPLARLHGEDVAFRPELAGAGDLNGDQKLDLALLAPDSPTLLILRGNGDGSFRPPLYYALDTAPAAMSIQDLNGDALPDLAFLHAPSPAPSRAKLTLEAAELNQDGFPDLLSAAGLPARVLAHLNSPQAARIEVSTLTNSIAGKSQAAWLTPVDAWNHAILDYQGTLRVVCSERGSTFNGDVAITPAERGMRLLSGVFYEPGLHSLDVTDLTHPGVTGSQSGIFVTNGIALQSIASQAVAVGAAASFKAEAISAEPVQCRWWQVVSTNLVLNGGFELAASPNSDLPAYWSCYSNGTTQVSRDRSDRTAGEFSCRIAMDAAGSYGAIGQNILVPGKDHLVRFQARREWQSAALQAYGSCYVPIAQALSPAWRGYAFHRVATNRFFSLARMFGESSSGVIFLDEVEVCRLEPVPDGDASELVLPPQAVTNHLVFVLMASNTLGFVVSPPITLDVTHPPQVQLASPYDWQFLEPGKPADLRADAADPDGAILKVEFLADGLLVGEAATPPYAVVWPNPTRGLHLLVARARDNLSVESASAPIHVFVGDLAGPPRLSLLPSLDPLGFDLVFTGSTGQQGTILFSTNLVGWWELTNAIGPFRVWIAPPIGGLAPPACFYRAVLQSGH